MAKQTNFHTFHKVIIGRSVLLRFVDFSDVAIPAKIDTGAYRSAVHAQNIKEKDGVLSFELLGKHPVYKAMPIKVKTRAFSKVKVDNSFGHSEERYEVKLRIKIGPKVFLTSFTLADRSKKIYPILIGRKALNSRFLVDTSQSTLNRTELKKKFGITFPVDEEDGRVEIVDKGGNNES